MVSMAIPFSMDDLNEMLRAMGLESWEELFKDIPKEARKEGINLKGMDEYELFRYSKKLADKNLDFFKMPNFLGAGVYFHFIPPVVMSLASRAEFYTSYTPYQAEMSQGMLQVLFEYQSLIAELTGMDVANSSMYDASTSLGEAVRMAHRINRKKEVLVPENIHWEKESVLKNYIIGLDMKIKKYPLDNKGMVDLDALSSLITSDTSAVYLENPNFFGIIDENAPLVRDVIGDSILIVGVNPISLGILKPPGDYGADIVIGEGQILGNPISFGGPLLGIFATRMKYVRKMPGRLIGMTKDADGRRAFVMTLQTREQHIRRGRATSNICSNEALCALMSTLYLAYLGSNGLRKLAKKNMENTNKLITMLKEHGFQAPHFNAPHFNEFLLDLPKNPHTVNKELIKRGVQGGYPINEGCFKGIGHAMLLCVTEMHTDEDMKKLIEALEEVI